MRIWLKDIRLEAEMTQEQVADEVGIARSYYTNIENGTKNPSVPKAQKIAKVLKFDWKLFFENNCSLKEHFVS